MIFVNIVERHENMGVKLCCLVLLLKNTTISVL